MEVIEEAIEADIEEEMREDSLDDDMDTQGDLGEDSGEGGHMQEDTPNVLNFLENILKSDNRFMTANLTLEELGRPTFSARFWLNLRNTSKELFNMPLVAAYCEMKARVTSDTSLSREGFMVSTSVTQKKVREKKNSSDLAKFLTGKGK